MREEHNIAQGNMIQVDNYGRGMTIRNIFNTNMNAHEMLNKTQNFIGTKKQSMYSRLRRKKDKKQFFDDLEIDDRMNNSVLQPGVYKNAPLTPVNYTPDNIIGKLSSMQDLQTDLNVDLIARQDSLMDMASPPTFNERRGRGKQNKKKGSRSRSPMGAYGGLPQGANPYDYARPLTKNKKKKGKKGDQFGKLDDFDAQGPASFGTGASDS